MEVSAKAEEIISQASNWTFAGDCSLLDWMEEIGNNLEQRAKATNQKFDQLSSFVKRTSVALDNASNSLTALQYTQFIENRCHDDDETIANTSNVPVQTLNTDQEEEEEDDSECDWKAILKDNLEIFHKFHERYSIDMDDSDEEEAANNVVYQTKNPYNARPLPHIYGTKEWNENWHVGLLEDNDEFSGDEVSDVFSESSSSAEDRQSFESNADNLSEWASSTSIGNEKSQPQLKVQNASSLKGSQLFPEDNMPKMSGAAAGSDSGSSASKTLTQPTTTNVEQYREQHRYDLFAPIQDTPPTSSSSSASLHQQSSSSIQSYTNISKGSIDSDRAEQVDKNKSFLDENIEEPSPSIPSNPSKLRRRPVNLFDDDDFNSFMTEIVDKVNNKQEAPLPTARKLSASSTSNSKSSDQKTKAAVNLFDSRSNSPTKIASPAPETNSSAIAKETPKKKTLNLFDSPDSPPEDDFLSKKPIVSDSKKEKSMVPKLYTNNLFDDDDDDEDFLNFFASKKPTIPKSISKAPLFDDESLAEESNDLFREPDRKIVTPKEYQKPMSHDLFGHLDQKTVAPKESQKPAGPSKKLDLFSDIDNGDSLFDEPKAQASAPPVEKDSVRNLLLTKNKLKLFDDDDEEDENDDLFPKTSRVIKESLPKKTDLFSAEKDSFIESTGIENTPIVQHEPPKVEKTVTPETYPIISEETNDEVEDEIMKRPVVLEKRQLQIEQEEQEVDKPHPKDVQESKDHPEEPVAKNNYNDDRDDINVASTSQEPKKDIFAESPIEDTSTEKISTEEPESFIPESSMRVPNLDTEQPTPTTYAGLFLDEPPEDDDAFFQTLDSNALANSKFSTELDPDFYEPALPKIPTEVVSPPPVSSANAYSSFGLFSEIPPDDDLDEMPSTSTSSNNKSEPKRIHSIFYDDFSETMEAVSKKPAESLPNVHSIFDDEPPPDDDFESLLNASVSKKPSIPSPGVKMSTPVNSKNQEVPSKDVIDHAKVSEKTIDIKKLSEELMEPKSKLIPAKGNTNISKLQMPKININVQALLPGAGQKPSFRKSLDDQKEREKKPEGEVVERSNPVQKVMTPAPYTNENILVNVCKNRVRAPARRRPSTRRGRQENYRKSLIAEQDADDGADETSETSGIQADEVRPDPPSDVPKVDSRLSSPETDLFSQKINSPDALSKDQHSKHEEMKSAKNIPQKLAAKIFDDDTEQDLFGSKSSTSSISSATAVAKKMPCISGGLFDDEDDNDDDFLFSKKEKPKAAEVPKTRSIPAAPIVESTAKTANFLDPKEPQEDPLFGSVSKSKSSTSGILGTYETPPEIPKDVPQAKESTSKIPDVGLFQDDDFLFEKVSNEQSQKDQVKKSISKEPAKTPLFQDDSESDSDDLFGTKSGSKVKSKNPSTRNEAGKISGREAGAASSKPTSIFGESDEEDDEDNFLKALKKKPVNPITKPIQSSAKSESKGLFSDSDDDDDDLFATKTSKAPKTVNTMHDPKRESSLNPGAIKSSTTTTTADNPLADLLND